MADFANSVVPTTFQLLAALALALAVSAVVLGFASLWFLHQMRARLRALTVPLWMGPWPPAPGTVYENTYDYTHLDFSWLAQGQHFEVRPGCWITGSRASDRSSTQCAQESAPAEECATALGRNIHTADHLQSTAQMGIIHLGNPDGDGLTRLNSHWNYSHAFRSTTDCGSNDLVSTNTSYPEAGRRQPDVAQGDFQQPDVRDSKAHASTVGVTQCVGELTERSSTTGGSNVCAPLYDDLHPQPCTVSDHRTDGIEHTQGGTQHSNAQCDALHNVDPCHSRIP